jgi:hypothetical protein
VVSAKGTPGRATGGRTRAIRTVKTEPVGSAVSVGAVPVPVCVETKVATIPLLAEGRASSAMIGDAGVGAVGVPLACGPAVADGAAGAAPAAAEVGVVVVAEDD